MKALLFLHFLTLTTFAHAIEGYYKYVGASYRGIVDGSAISGVTAKDITYLHISKTHIASISFRPTGKYYETTNSKYYLMDDIQDTFFEVIYDTNDPCYTPKEHDYSLVMRVFDDPHGFRILSTAVGLIDNKTPYSFESTTTLMDIPKEEYELAEEKTKSMQKACFDTDGNVERKL